MKTVLEKYLSFFLCFCAFALVVSCGKVEPKGKLTTKDFTVQPFQSLELQGKYRIFLVPATNHTLVAESYPNVIDNLEIKTINNILKISEKRPVGHADFYNLTLYFKDNLQSLTLSDSVECTVSGRLSASKIELKLKDNSKFIGAVANDRMAMDAAQSALANLTGFTKHLTLKTKDSANVLAPYWNVEVANLHLKNATYTELTVEDSLLGNAEDHAKLLYYKSPIRAIKIGQDTNVQNKNTP